MASTTGNHSDGGVDTATNHNITTTKNHVGTDLNSISQFIFLEAGRDPNNGGKSDFSYESSLDIMTVQNNEDLKDDFSEFINIPSLVSDDEDIESVVMNKDSSHVWKKQRSLQPSPTTIPSNFSERENSSVQQQQPQPKNEGQLQTVHLHHPKPVVHQDVQKVKRTSKARIQPTLTIEDVTKSVKQSTTTISPTKELTPAERKLEQTQIMTIIVKYVTAKIQNSFPPESPRNQKPNEMPLDKFLLLLTSRLRLTLPVFLKAVIYLFRYMDIIYLLRYLNQTNNFVNYNDMGFELKKLIIGCFKLAIIKENRVLKNKYVLNWETITGLKNREINDIVKTIVDRMNGKLNIKNVDVIRMKEEMYRFVKMVSIEV